MENRNHNGLVFLKEVEHTVLRESPQPSAAYIGKANGMQKGTVRQGRDQLVSLSNEVFPQARFVVVVPSCGRQNINFGRRELFDDDVHEVS